MTALKLMRKCRLSKLNKVQLDYLEKYNYKMKNIFAIELITVILIILFSNVYIEIVGSLFLACVLMYEVYLKLNIKKITIRLI